MPPKQVRTSNAVDDTAAEKRGNDPERGWRGKPHTPAKRAVAQASTTKAASDRSGARRTPKGQLRVNESKREPSDVDWGEPGADKAAWDIGTSAHWQASGGSDHKPQRDYWDTPMPGYSDVQWGVAADAGAWGNASLDDAPLTIEEFKARESQIRADQVHDMVPFWIRGIEAANEGYVLRLEEFLESLDDRDSWSGGDGSGWGDASRGWGGEADAKRWNIETESNKLDRANSAHTEDDASLTQARRRTEPSNAGNMVFDPFVEDVALQEAVDSDRKKRMQEFLQLNTDDKLRAIQALIQDLKT
ncbi:hypothetical protein PC9H_003498 [Pleurotus ostreatus]|uniref:Uncharacterized protein n=2 Tax=Pleurotus TaxID=5320 RepID=A0A8H7A5Z7_PLEOS|nr:uncharacterized protein PC9H_003498 [Pleurotus ostreatus]KAF7436665.1 hypothetical protein PC9H_003498 [Pleurotus ostreatus]KAG9222663.1 hypothetical protein CCMSSC00406_0004577 [Pleurotus cornucopiae]